MKDKYRTPQLLPGAWYVTYTSDERMAPVYVQPVNIERNINGDYVADLKDNTLGEITYNSFFDDDPYVTLSDAELSFQDWVHGVLGSTMLGWMVMAGFLVSGPFRRGEQWSWNALAAGILAWFVFDTGTSLAHSVVFNAAFNTIFLVAFGAPLVATFRAFHPRQ